MLKIGLTKNQIERIINQVVEVYDQKGSNSPEFKSLYHRHYLTLEAHKKETLIFNIGRAIKVKGRLVRRGDGLDSNLNLISPLWINGVKLEHLHVFDGVIDVLTINTEGNFKTTNLEVFSYTRTEGSKGYGLMPKGSCREKYSKRAK